MCLINNLIFKLMLWKTSWNIYIKARNKLNSKNKNNNLKTIKIRLIVINCN